MHAHIDHGFWLDAVVVFLIVICAAGAMRMRWLALPLVGLSAWWLHLDSRLECGYLLYVDKQHGLVVPDMVSLAGFAIALWALLPVRARPKRDD